MSDTTNTTPVTEPAASAEWVRTLESRVSKLEQAEEERQALKASRSNDKSKGFVTFDDLEKRLGQSHSTVTAVAAKFCPECGSPGHENCGKAA